jgi:Zn-dependent peptidase ImmA (M78 family)
MPSVRVSAVRFSSLLMNRNMTPEFVATKAKTSVRPQDLIQSDQEVELEDLLELAKVFSRPWSYLLADAAEVFPARGSDNRTFENQQVSLSPGLIDDLQFADLILSTAADLFPGAGYQTPDVPLQRLTSKRLANEIRAFIGVSINEQLAAKDEYSALRSWIAAINNRGVYVSQRRLEDSTVRAFSKVAAGQAVIVISTKDEPLPRIFSLLHEYCHIALHSTGICDLLDFSDTERFCNEVAAAVLLPPDLLRILSDSAQFTGNAQEDDDSLRKLSRRAHVSQQVLLIGLRDYGAISQILYEEMEYRRSVRRSRKRTGGGGDYYTVAINQAGRMFVTRVVDAMREGTVDRKDVSALVGVGEHNIGKLIQKLASGN